MEYPIKSLVGFSIAIEEVGNGNAGKLEQVLVRLDKIRPRIMAELWSVLVQIVRAQVFIALKSPNSKDILKVICDGKIKADRRYLLDLCPGHPRCYLCKK